MSPISAESLSSPRIFSPRKRTGEPGNELDELRLAVDPGLLVDVAKVGLDRLGGDAERLRHVGNPADLDYGQKHAQLSGRELVSPGNDLRWRGSCQRRLLHEHGRSGSVRLAGPLPR